MEMAAAPLRRLQPPAQVLDCSFGEIPDPPALAARLCGIPGVVEHGLFIGMAEMALIGKDGRVIQLRR